MISFARHLPHFATIFSVREGTCSNDVLGIEGTNEYGLSACCPSECNQCGGKGCGTSGLPKYTYQSCCVGAVVHTFEHCENKKTAPCAIVGESGGRDEAGRFQVAAPLSVVLRKRNNKNVLCA